MTSTQSHPIRWRIQRAAALAGACVLASIASGSAMAADVPAAPNKGVLIVKFEGLRSERGILRACLTKDREKFLKCEDDSAAFKASTAAGTSAHIQFNDVPPGDYALLVMHDENSNAKLDTMLGIPREGIGFSRNPRLRFGPPGINAVIFAIPAGATETAVKLKYFL